MCERIQSDTGFSERITPIRFRTTVLTDMYDQTKDMKQTQQAAGHANVSTTMKHYVKGARKHGSTSCGGIWAFLKGFLKRQRVKKALWHKEKMNAVYDKN